MSINNFISFCFFLITLLAFSCNVSQTKNSDITNDYVLITTAISTSKDSRLKFQDKFSVALDSFLIKDNPNVKLNELMHLLDDAKRENKKAIQLVSTANEIDSTLNYKYKALEMFMFLDVQYTYNYPEVFKIMKSASKDKKSQIAPLIVPSTDSFKIKATEVINTANLVVDKYDINLAQVSN